MQILKRLRVFTLLAALVIGLLSTAVVSHAVQTITTPNVTMFSYNLAAGGRTAAVSVAANQGILVMGDQLNVGFRGIGQATLLSVPANFLEWVALESPSAAGVTSGFSAAAGTHIVWIDFSHTVGIEVASATAIQVHNAGGGAASGNVKLIW